MYRRRVEERITLGRALDNMIRLEDGTVSHNHAMLVLDGADYKLRDLNSTNGTLIAGARIAQATWPAGETIMLGHTPVRLEPPVAPEAPAAVPAPPAASNATRPIAPGRPISA